MSCPGSLVKPRRAAGSPAERCACPTLAPLPRARTVPRTWRSPRPQGCGSRAARKASTDDAHVTTSGGTEDGRIGTSYDLVLAAEPVSATTAATNHEITVVLPANLHARPAGKLARAATGFSSSVQLEHGGRTVNPTGVLSVMGLGAAVGSTVTVRAEAHEAVTALADILANAE